MDGWEGVGEMDEKHRKGSGTKRMYGRIKWGWGGGGGVRVERGRMDE